MNLYQIQHDGSTYYVEADSYGEAVELWQKFLVVEEERDFGEQPDTVSILSTHPVIRSQEPKP